MKDISKRFVGKIIAIISLAVFMLPDFAFSEEAIHFHGYGELHYNNTTKPKSVDKMDHHRLVLGWTYTYNDRISLNVEIDYEHAAQEMELEFAFIDFRFNDAFNIRAGSLLMPVGYLNEFHEPPLFYSVERPYVQKDVIPTTWQEGGVGLFGSLKHGVRYRAYLVGGLDASRFSASSGIRNGRHKVAESPSDDLAVVGQVEYSGVEGLRLGFSGYHGNSGQGTSGIGSAPVSLAEFDIRYRFKNIEFTTLYSLITIDDTKKIKTVTDNTIGKKIEGSYVEVAYHLGELFLPEKEDIVLFARYELFDTQKKIEHGLKADPKNDRTVTTFGLAYFPIQKVSVKCDFEMWKNGNNDSWEQFNVGLGYMF